MTASVQWLERTLDDSAGRRISIPEAFLAADSILRLAGNVVKGLAVNEKMIEKALNEYLPFIATENIMMEAVKKGGDRQKIHEIIRRCSVESSALMKEGKGCDLLLRLSEQPDIGLRYEELEKLMDPAHYTGRCSGQVEAYLKKVRELTGTVKGTDQGEKIEL